MEPQPPHHWPAKRIAALFLTIALAGLALYIWHIHGDRRSLELLTVGIVLGSMYTINGGSLPDWVHRARDLHGVAITADDDPRNLSPRLYLPILGAAILLAVILFLVYGRR